jgi:hypothetical protein
MFSGVIHLALPSLVVVFTVRMLWLALNTREIRAIREGYTIRRSKHPVLFWYSVLVGIAVPAVGARLIVETAKSYFWDVW